MAFILIMHETTFWLLVFLWIAIAFITFFYLLRKPAPYGRYSTSQWGPTISNRAGWIIMEWPVLIIMLGYLISFYNDLTSPVLCGFALFIIHYAERCIIYPFRLKTKGKRMPLIIAGSAILFNLINGNILGYSLAHNKSYPPDYLQTSFFLLGTIIFFTGMAINIKSDSILFNLRSGKESGYKIPKGGLFERVSCPNFFGEILEWLGFAIASNDLGAWSFFIWTCANLIPRALHHHAWYKRSFGDYPADRKALIPYLL